MSGWKLSDGAPLYALLLLLAIVGGVVGAVIFVWFAFPHWMSVLIFGSVVVIALCYRPMRVPETEEEN